MRIGDPSSVRTLFGSYSSRMDTSPGTEANVTQAHWQFASGTRMSLAWVNALFGLSVNGAARSESDELLRIVAGHGANINGSDRSEFIEAGSRSRVNGGGGDDAIVGTTNSTLNGGAGNDWIAARARSVLNGGAGDDLIGAWTDSTISGGEGNDRIEAGYRSHAYGGEGNDAVRAWMNSRVDGDSGNDIISTGLYSSVAGGAGDDVIEVSYSGYVDAGTGDDSIDIKRSVVIGFNPDGSRRSWVENNVVLAFNKGDGRDVITLEDPDVSATIKLGADFNADQMKLQQVGEDVVITFEGSEDTITLRGATASVRLDFADGTAIDLRDRQIQ